MFFKAFDFSVLDKPDFSEAAVREAIVFSILQRLGYGSHGTNLIHWNKSLTHPSSASKFLK